MEILNYLSDMETYQSGLVADSLDDVIRAPHFIDTIILDNAKMLSDSHTFYIVDLTAVLHPDKVVLTLIQDLSGHDMLVRYLNEKNYEMVNENMEYWDDDLEPRTKKWRFIKRRKENKKHQLEFMKQRVEIPPKNSLLDRIKNRLKREES